MADAASLLLGIDVGGTGTKVGLFTSEGSQLGTVGRKVDSSLPALGHTERDADKLWLETADAIRQVLERCGASGSHVAAVGVTGHGNGLYLVGHDGNSVRPAINSTDSRAASRVAWLHKSGRATDIRRKTLQSIWPGQPEVLLHWLSEHEPHVLERVSYALMSKDFVRFRLTGSAAVELTDMSTTNLVDLRTGVLDDDLFEAFEIKASRRLFPHMLNGTEIGGYVTKRAAGETGLLEGTPVAAGVIDMVACALGSGVVADGSVSVVAGTWSINQTVTAHPVERDDLFMVGRFIGSGSYLKVEASPSSAGNFDWYVSALKNSGTETSFSELLDRTAKSAMTTSPGADGVLFLPYIFGSRDTSHAKGTFFGLDSHHRSAHIDRSVMEGVAFEHRVHLERLLREETWPASVRLSGGVARSQAWRQVFADCLQTNVEVCESDEPGALGAALCASVSIGLHRDIDSAVAAMTRIKSSTTFDPNAVEPLNQAYKRRSELNAALSHLVAGS